MNKENKMNICLPVLESKLFQRIEEDSYPSGLAYGYVGLAIYFFERLMMTGNRQYEKYAKFCVFTNTNTNGISGTIIICHAKDFYILPNKHLE